MITQSPNILSGLVVACALGLGPAFAGAQMQANTLTITGRGGADLVPNALEARFELASNAETAKEALTSLETKVQKAADLIGKVKGAKIKPTDARLTAHGERKNVHRNVQIRALGGGTVWLGNSGRGGAQGPSFSAGRTMVVRLEGLAERSQAERMKALAVLLDASREAGLSVIPGLDRIRGQGRIYGNNPNPSGNDNGGPFSFVGDKDAALKKAQRAALEDARLRAEQIATLAGRKLGPVKSLESGKVTTPSDKLVLGGVLTVELKVIFSLE